MRMRSAFVVAAAVLPLAFVLAWIGCGAVASQPSGAAAPIDAAPDAADADEPECRPYCVRDDRTLSWCNRVGSPDPAYPGPYRIACICFLEAGILHDPGCRGPGIPVDPPYSLSTCCH